MSTVGAGAPKRLDVYDEASMFLHEGTVAKHIIADILRTGDIQPYLDAGLSRDWIRRTDVFEYTERNAYEWILTHFETHEEVPTRELFRKAFPKESFRLPGRIYRPSELLELVAKYVSTLAALKFANDLYDLREEDQLLDFGKVDAAWSEYTATRVHAAGTGSRSSWEPIDAGAWLDGDQKPLEAELGARDDGVFLLYPGKTHSLVGESEAGKSWLALYWVAQELEAGHDVGYIDFEDSADGIFGRLVELADATAIRKHFKYLRPESTLTDAAGLAERLSVCSLVVVDGITEAMEMVPNPSNTNDWNGRFAHFQGVLLNPIAARGPAVLSIDHPVKSDPQSRHASGAGHKLRGLSGASYVLVNQEPFGRGRRGLSKVYVAKDRHGHVRTQGQWDKHVKMIRIADLVIDNIDHQVATEVFLKGVAEFGEWKPTILMQRASETLSDSGEPLTKTQLQGKVTGNKQHVMRAIDILTEEAYFSVDVIGGRKYLTSVKLYTAPKEGFDDL